ncbi:PHD finger and JmjC domain-containing protein, variant 3 [Blastomyces gilchristii SLH14081]|uniref:JmjC domain-containing histone demethylation protein 1 n=1 Tax=Blastomyces gilchristii (strain SLH14081) TaxID=559298 RepID=A0A179UNM5_BLAGS|nr:PHD finger and JmjC domain-containing protein [Blastomyces gilchristii SLH14081]XP_031578955.1 PHD finger and JmjC domain-containing protein, variant 1 [Blastomyces gilchristii SLH14081]XP_031578956.1 PHD finger and JmjC domain-containing protein, variant 2 [Blastomyces gilchristii SLH14081]XP_031578957.1 PHD finger and JmjC domain-containing protein, variant 3 [Blastomyces gilchristii SLH14081]OAT09684.1 PHD finger and JmjC domain-containing protein [Blastomyces gilchristii SLH14081]OAT096
MANTSSFRNPSRVRPLRYRTPSPPRHAIESISPRAPADSSSSSIRNTHPSDGVQQPRNDPPFVEKGSSVKPGWNNNTFQDGRESLDHRYSHHPPGGSSSNHANTNPTGRVGHQRSGSNIDTLATIALATSPTFAPLTYDEPATAISPTTHQAPTPNQSERPSKRARSEKAPSPTWLMGASRPATSHVSTFDSMKTDAELLLNFARPSNFPPLYDASRPQQLAAHESTNGQNPGVKWATDPAELWTKRWDITAENKPSSAFFRSNNNGTPSRIRSKSDGSAFTARPFMNGFASGHFLAPSIGPALEDDSVDPHYIAEENHDTTLQANGPDTQQAPRPLQRPKSIPASDFKEEDSDNDSSGQATCAACHLDRVASDSEGDEAVTWINCDGCMRWFHIVCAGFKSDRDTRTVDKFICRGCRPTHGPTTFVRKSSRARTAIDYASLNQGYVMPSAETPEHHYIQPIKEGKITFLPDHFARIRPELVTAEYFERGIGMTEPIIIPASLNTRSSVPGSADYYPPEASTQEEFDELADNMPDDDADYNEVIDCGQDLLDMVIPQGLTVRHVAELYGPEERVEVIDVKSQQGEDKRWNMQRWADYYYDDSTSKAVRNVISLEVSNSPLGRLIRRPKIVRDLDLQDHVWPAESQAIGEFPKVQFYVLMSVADCYTDFHVDFGGSSVYYHILKGKKSFFFIPPKDKHLKKYEEWCNSAAQDTTFLGNQTKECYRVDLSAGDTMLIPSGWIHAVWTPEDSLVIGGNFLTKMNYGMQIKIAKIEKDTKVPKKFRYPYFQKIMWYAAIKYLEDDPIPQTVLESFSRDENYRFYREYPIYYESGENDNRAEPGSQNYNARFYSQAELDGLPELAKYLLRTALIAGGYHVDGVTTETRNAVKRSIPKGQADPVDTIIKFGVWVAWKRGNEHAASWTRPGAISLDTKVDMSGRKPTVRPSRRSQRNIAAESLQLNNNLELRAGRRPSYQSSEINTSGMSSTGFTSTSAPSTSGTPAPPKREASLVDVDEIIQSNKPRSISKPTGLGPKRVACDACRKRRIRCRHKDEQSLESFTSLTAKQQPLNGKDMAAAGALNLASAAHVDRIKEQHSGKWDEMLPNAMDDSSALLMTPQANSAKAKGFSPNSSNSGKKGRSKACDECRKSKRRCIHDENGRIDPIKAQERSKPRAATSTKRPRSSDDNISPTSNKRQKPEFEYSGEELPQTKLDFEAVQLQGRMNGPNEKLGSGDKVGATAHSELTQSQTSYASPPTLKADLVPPSEVTSSLPATTAPASSLVSPPTSLADDMEVDPNQTDGETKAAVKNEQQQQQQQYGELSVVDDATATLSRNSSSHPRLVPEATVLAGEHKTTATAARAPPATVTAPSDLSVTIPSSSTSTSIIKKPSSYSLSSSSSRPSSSHHRTNALPLPSSSSTSSFKQERETKQHNPVVDKKRVEGSHPSPHPNRHSNSRTSPTSPHQRNKLTSRDTTRGSFSDADADPETLRLIREMQEQDFGLRKRPSRT